MKLRIALRAFMAIMKDRPHVFSDAKYTSIAGTAEDIHNCTHVLFDNIDDMLCQELAVKRAKDILNDRD